MTDEQTDEAASGSISEAPYDWAVRQAAHLLGRQGEGAVLLRWIAAITGALAALALVLGFW